MRDPRTTYLPPGHARSAATGRAEPARMARKTLPGTEQEPSTDRRFNIATPAEILAGTTTDVYFPRAVEVLERESLADTQVFAEVTAGKIPVQTDPDPLDQTGLFAGLDEALTLLEGHNVDAWAIPEGTRFPAKDARGVRFPVLQITGAYREFAVLETPLLGLLCQASGIATKTARMRILAGDASILSFGIRRMHPAIAPMVDRAAYFAGADGVSGVLGARRIGIEPRGTMPHAMILIFGDSEKAFAAWNKHTPKEVPRAALVDTFSDEARETEAAVTAMGRDLHAVRLDTPGSRRGDLPALAREIRWRLDQAGHEKVAVFTSGGIDEADLKPLTEAGVTGFGIGTSIAAAPPVDFALDIVATERRGPWAKRGKFPGAKDPMQCGSCGRYWALARQKPAEPAKKADCPHCGKTMRNLLVPAIQHGEVEHREDVETIRKRAQKTLQSPFK